MRWSGLVPLGSVVAGRGWARARSRSSIPPLEGADVRVRSLVSCPEPRTAALFRTHYDPLIFSSSRDFQNRASLYVPSEEAPFVRDARESHSGRGEAAASSGAGAVRGAGRPQEPAATLHERRLRKLLENALESVTVLSPDGEIMEHSVALERMLGYDPGELRGEHAFGLVHPADREATEAVFRDLLARPTGSVVTHEYRCVRKDGGLAYLESVATNLVDDPDIGGVVVNSRDVSARKRAERELAAREAHLRAILDAEPECVKLVGPDGAILDMNPAGLAMLGAEELPEIIGRSIYGFVAPEHRDAYRHVHAAALRGGGGRLEFQLLGPPDQPPRWMSSHMVPLRGPGGAVAAVLSIARDVTEQRRARDALAASERRFRALLEALPVGVVVADAGGALLEANPAALHAWGAERLEASPREYTQFHARRMPSGEPLPAGDWAMARVLRGEMVENPEELEIEAFDGVRRRLLHYAFPLRDEAGSLTGGVVVLVDLTALRATEAALHESESRLRLSLERMPAVLWMTDAELRLTWAEGAGFTGIGVAPAERIGQSLFEFFETGDAAFAPIAAHRRSLAGETVDYEMDWAGRTFHAHVQPLREGERITGVIGFALDLTEQRLLESQLHQAQKMEAVGRLAGGIAHDFNNILTSIQGFTELLLGDADRADPRRADLEEIRRAAERAASLTRQLLAFSRRQVLQPTVLDLGDVLTAMEPMLRRVIGEDIAFTVDADPQAGRVEADPGQMEQVILNLVVNARDAMPGGGRLTVSTAARSVTAAEAARLNGIRPGPYVELRVRDTGVGIDPETRARIFEPFFTTKEHGRGTGLGLSTVYGILDQSGGTVAVDSAPEGGTLFRALLPRTERVPAAPRPRREADAAPRTTEATVLLVEDDAAVRALAVRALRRAGYHVLEAADGAGALAVLEDAARGVQLVVTDVVMPGMGGRELASRIAERWGAIPILFTSGYTEDEVLRRGIRELDEDFLAKPFSPEELAGAVAGILGRGEGEGG